MKAFRFALETVRTLRESREHQAMEQYALALSAHQLALRQLSHAEQKLAQTQSNMHQELIKGSTAGQISGLQACCTALQDRRDECRNRAELSRKNVEDHMARWGAARKDREILEKYLLQQRARYNREITRLEQKELDEIAQIRWANSSHNALLSSSAHL